MTLMTDDDTRRSRLESELRMIRQEFAQSRANSVRGFAHVRDTYPEAAKILYSGRDLRLTNLKDADLCDIDLGGSDLTGCDFTNARIAGAHFEFAKVSRDALAKARDWHAYLENWQPRDVASPIFFQREPGERFGFAPFLPEVVILPPELLAKAGELPAGNETVLKLSGEEQQFLSGGRLAVAIRCLTAAEWASVINPGRTNVDRTEPILLHSFAANAYCSELTKDPRQFGLPGGTRVALPGFALFHLMALAGQRGGLASIAADRTDLSLDDLGVGTGQGAEFVERWSDRQQSTITAAELLHTANVRLFQPPPERALLRPIFFLGGEG